MKAADENKVRNFLKVKDPIFLAACEKAKIPPTRRQASKWLSARGLAYKVGR